MIDVSASTAVGYAIFDAGLRAVSCNQTYAQLVRLPRTQIVGKDFGTLFPGAEKIELLLRKVLAEGISVRLHSFPYTFRHWTRWEERYYDVSAHLMGEPNDKSALVLIRVSEAIGELTPDIPSILRKLRENESKPLFSGEDVRGRFVDIYVHPQAELLPDKLVLIAVHRDTHQHITYEIPRNALHRIMLAAYAAVKS